MKLSRRQRRVLSVIPDFTGNPYEPGVTFDEVIGRTGLPRVLRVTRKSREMAARLKLRGDLRALVDKGPVGLQSYKSRSGTTVYYSRRSLRSAQSMRGLTQQYKNTPFKPR